MKHQLFTFALFIVTVLSCTASGNQSEPVISISDTLHIATFNVRIRTTSDIGIRSWQNRKPLVVSLIQRNLFDVFGVQELVDIEQENELTKALPSYAVFSKGRDNTAGTRGERLAIFYLKDRYRRIQEGFFFLSETPDKASKGWDASLNRICQWLQLQDKITGMIFFVFNTHFDHIGKESRAMSAQLVSEKIKEIAAHNPVFLLGDFNASPYETKVYNTLTQSLFDTRSVSKQVTEPSVGTFNGWNTQVESFAENVRIDYIFTSEKRVEEYQVINDKYAENAYPSDHFPVMIRYKAR
jgi:endonuclease/exonuclease/phosphatase family metal-dependent hydrolase